MSKRTIVIIMAGLLYVVLLIVLLTVYVLYKANQQALDTMRECELLKWSVYFDLLTRTDLDSDVKVKKLTRWTYFNLEGAISTMEIDAITRGVPLSSNWHNAKIMLWRVVDRHLMGVESNIDTNFVYRGDMREWNCTNSF